MGPGISDLVDRQEGFHHTRQISDCKDDLGGCFFHIFVIFTVTPIWGK